MIEELKNCSKYLAWRNLSEKNGLCFSGEKILSVISKKKSRDVLFAFLKIEAKNRDGIEVPPCVLIRGHAVVIIPILKIQGSLEPFVILVRQFRVASGGFEYELPAGMIDESHSPYEVALKEFEEEVGLSLNGTTLFQVNREPLFTSPGLLDEGIFYFFFEKDVSEELIHELQDAKKGDPSENEHIVLSLVPFHEAFSKVRSIPALYGLAWYFMNRISASKILAEP